MTRIRLIFKAAFTPITIMLIPHSHEKTFRLKMPSIGMAAVVILWMIGTLYVLSVAVDVLEYNRMKQKLNYYSSQFMELKSTILTLKKAEGEFNRIFSVKSKEKILENLDNNSNGSLDMAELKKQLAVTVNTVGDIKDYLSRQRDIYHSTPKGWPAEGRITSPFGQREHPKSGEDEFHTGMDIAAEPGTIVKATADGIVSFAGWSGGNGNLVVVEHGAGFSTLYGHNKMVDVRVGRKVKRGDTIGYMGSTGNSTGPHVHYEVWLEGRPQNPQKYIQGGS